jgi:hypothetical protein
MVALYWFLCLAQDGRPRHWLYLGISLGVGLEVKYTIAGLIVGVVIAVLVTPALRIQLRTRYPWIAAGIALLIWAPNLAWQVVEGFPSLTYIANHGGSGGGPLTYLLEFGIYFFFLIPVWIVGIVSLFRSPRLRPVGIACAVPLVLFLFTGKSYYAAGSIPIAVAQGLMAISGIRRPRLRSGLQIAVVVTSVVEFAVFFLLVVPVTPPNRIHAENLDSVNEVFADSVGWDEVAQQVTALYAGLPASERSGAIVISAYYGVPGALAVYGRGDVPVAVSPQLSSYYWLPGNLSATYALMVDYQPPDVAWMCSSPELIGHLTVPYQVKGLEQNAPVILCALTEPLAQAWPRLRNFS